MLPSSTKMTSKLSHGIDGATAKISSNNCFNESCSLRTGTTKLMRLYLCDIQVLLAKFEVSARCLARHHMRPTLHREFSDGPTVYHRHDIG